MKKTKPSKPRKVRETKTEYRVRSAMESDMTLIEQIQKLLLKLSPAQQREALDFVAFLQLRSSKPPEPVTEAQRGERIKDAFAQLANMKTFSDITDPVAWQRNTREDRGLPGRAA